MYRFLQTYRPYWSDLRFTELIVPLNRFEHQHKQRRQDYYNPSAVYKLRYAENHYDYGRR